MFENLSNHSKCNSYQEDHLSKKQNSPILNYASKINSSLTSQNLLLHKAVHEIGFKIIAKVTRVDISTIRNCGLRPAAQTTRNWLSYRAMAVLTSPIDKIDKKIRCEQSIDRTNKYIVLASHQLKNLFINNIKETFGDNLVVTAKNIPQEHVIKNDECKQAAYDLYDTIKTHEDSNSKKNLFSLPKKEGKTALETARWNGICCGMTLDIANQIIPSKPSSLPISPRALKEAAIRCEIGGMKEAAANQAVYDSLQFNWDPNILLDSCWDELVKIHALTKEEQQIANDYTKNSEENKSIDLYNMSPNLKSMCHLYDLICKVVENTKIEENKMNDLEHCAEKMMENIEKIKLNKGEDEKKIIEQTVAVIGTAIHHQQIAPILQARNIQLTSLNQILGLESRENDSAYLKNLNKLPAGAYYISLNTSKGGHAILYYKGEVGPQGTPGYIFDSNSGLISIGNSSAEHTEQIKKILDIYGNPGQLNEPNHHLRMNRLERAATRS